MSQFSTLNLVYEVIKFLLFSLGIYKILGKLGANRRWMSWLPGLRYFALGNALDLHTEGIVCGVLEVLYLGLGYLDADWLGENGTIAVGVFVVVVAITLYIYRIRLFMRTLAIFHLRRRWVWLWLVANWLCFLILGLSKKIQPQQDVQRMEEEELAGTAPAELAGVKELQWKGPAASGLSIDVRERTVKDFGKKRYLLKDIVMDIPKGSMVLLLGGSGAGKTTFVNAVIGYEKADAEVFLNGRDVYRNYDEVKYRIGFVPQQNLIRGNDTVLRTIADSTEMRLPKNLSRKDRREKTRQVLDMLGLASGSRGLVCKKSGGQLRRISIAMELVADPELFVLDEPDSGLDGVIAREIFEKLRTIADTGKIVMVITHSPDRVIDLFDKVIVLAKDSGRVGRLAFYGSPQEAKDFFGRDSMEKIVLAINRKEEGGEGMADEFIGRYAQMVTEQKGGAVA